MATSENPETAAADPVPSGKTERGSLGRFILLLVLLAWALRSFIVAPFNIPSSSMLPTLYIGDYLMVAKWPYGYSRYSFPWQFPSFSGRVPNGLPNRGDVVVFHHPAENADLIKRVIGLPGDTIEVRDGVLLLNGQELKREKLPPLAVPISDNSPCKVAPGARPIIAPGPDGQRCLYVAYRETLPSGPSYVTLNQVDGGPGDDFAAEIVPPGHVFLMGDNRDDSGDSRFSVYNDGIGMVPTDHLIGRALFTFWSTDGSASYVLPWTWFTALRGSRLGNGYHE